MVNNGTENAAERRDQNLLFDSSHQINAKTHNPAQTTTSNNLASRLPCYSKYSKITHENWGPDGFQV